MKKDDRVYLHHIVDAIARIEKHLTGISQKMFTENDMVQDAVIRQLEIIGEASRNLSEEVKEKYPEIPWVEIVAMRNRIVHAYFDVNLEIAWGVSIRDLPALKQNVEKIIREI